METDFMDHSLIMTKGLHSSIIPGAACMEGHLRQMVYKSSDVGPLRRVHESYTDALELQC